MPINLTTRLERAQDLMSTQVDDDIVILNLKTNHYIALDAIGRRIWELLANPIGVDQICEQLNQEFRGSPEQIRADVLAFLNELESEDMLIILA